MKLGSLRKAVQSLTPDLDDLEVVMITATNGNPTYENLAAVGYVPKDGLECVALVTVSEIVRRVKSGELKVEQVRNELEEGEEWKQG